MQEADSLWLLNAAFIWLYYILSNLLYKKQQIPKPKRFLSHIAASYVQYIEARC